jgi:hypothetical protein
MTQRPVAPRPSPAAGSATVDEVPTAAVQQKGGDLTVNKVLAGAGAAVTSALLGSYLGATGTVIGAAVGSVAITVSSTLYQRYLDRTRDTIVARIRLTPNGRTDLSDTPTVRLDVPEPRVSPEGAVTELQVQPVLRAPRRIWMWAGATVLVFVLGLLVVTGLEWANGSSLTTGQQGTSVGRVLAPAPATDEPDAGAADEGADATEEAEPDGAATDATPTDEPRSDDTGTEEPTPTADPSGETTPTDEPRSSDQRSGPAAEDERGSTTGEPRPTAEIRIPAVPRNG